MQGIINDDPLIRAATDPSNSVEALRQLADQSRRAYEYEKAVETYSDTVAFRRTAHSIKSSSASFGALPLVDAARKLEQVAQADDKAVVGERIDHLEQLYVQVQDQLREEIHE